MEEPKAITDLFRRNEEGKWYNVNTKNPADRVMQELLDKFEREMGVRPEEGKGILFARKTGEMSVAKDLPKVSGTGEKISSEFDKNLKEKLGDLIPGLMGAAIKGLRGLFTKNITTDATAIPASSTDTTAIPVPPSVDSVDISSSTAEEVEPDTPFPGTKAFNKRDPEGTALGKELGVLFEFAVDKLTSIDDGIHELVAYVKGEEKEEGTKEAELEKEKTKERKEKASATKEEKIKETVRRGEELESETILGKAGKSVSENFRLSLGSKLPILGLLSSGFDPAKIGTDADPFQQKSGATRVDETKKDTGFASMIKDMVAFAAAIRAAIIPLAIMTAKFIAVAAAVAGLVAVVGGLAAVMGAFGEDIKAQTIQGIDDFFGVTTEDRKAMNKFMDKNINPIVDAVGGGAAALGGFLARPFQSTSNPEGLEAAPQKPTVPPPAAPVKKPAIQPQATQINKATQEVKKAEAKRNRSDSQQVVQNVINNNNSKTSSTTVVLGGSRGALDFALA